MVAADAQWHVDKRKSILESNPEIKKLEGAFWGSAPCIVGLVCIQWYIWYLVNDMENYLLMGLIAYANANTLFYMLSTFIHENSHGLILGFPLKWRVLSAVLIELGFCSFGEQWEYTIVHNIMHHPQLNDQARDSECPAEGHVAVVPEGPLKYLVFLVELLPLGTLLTQGQLSNNAQHSQTKHMFYPWLILVCTSLSVYATLLYLGMYNAILFAAWTTSLYSSRWCISLHGQSISEHYRHNFEPTQKGKFVAPTHSTYYWLENFIGFNTGYHDEHHTFANIAWYHLPKLKQQFPEKFDNVNDRRYLALWWEWASNEFETTRFRICHQPTSKGNST